YSPHFADIVARSAHSPDRIKLIKKVNARRFLHCLKYQVQLNGSLSHILGDERVQFDQHQRKVAFAGERGRRHALAATWRTNEEKTLLGAKPVSPKAIALTVLSDHSVKVGTQLWREHHLGEANIWIGGRQQPS